MSEQNRTQNCTDNVSANQALGGASTFIGPDEKKILAIATENVQLQRKVDIAFAGHIYIGEALPGTATDSPEWRIKRIASGQTVAQLANDMYDFCYADDDVSFSKKWDDRATYTYAY